MARQRRRDLSAEPPPEPQPEPAGAAGGPAAGAGGQWLAGNQNVQIASANNASIRITFGDEVVGREVPLRAAVVPVGARVTSPARLLRASSGVIPYVPRGRVLEELEAWANSPGAFAGCVVGGRGRDRQDALGDRVVRARWQRELVERTAVGAG
jgi:hypothetical protein